MSGPPTEQLAGRVAVVTGGGAGLGEAMARAFANAGMAVAVLDIDADAAASVARSIVSRVLTGQAPEPNIASVPAL